MLDIRFDETSKEFEIPDAATQMLRNQVIDDDSKLSDRVFDKRAPR